MSNSFYREEILDHFKKPRNFGKLQDADRVGRAVNRLCGDDIVMTLKLAGDSGRHKIAEIKFRGRGCAISLATASMLTEMVKGMLVSEIKRLNRNDILDLIGIRLSPTRLKCALLPLEALQTALFDEGRSKRIN